LFTQETISFGVDYVFGLRNGSSSKVTYNDREIDFPTIKFNDFITGIGGNISRRNLSKHWYSRLSIFYPLGIDSTISATNYPISVSGQSKGSDFDIALMINGDIGVPFDFPLSNRLLIGFDGGVDILFFLLKGDDQTDIGGGIGLFTDILLQYYLTEKVFMSLCFNVGFDYALWRTAIPGYYINSNNFIFRGTPSINIGFKIK
jgi:hypothetical protein